jgi:hypothetical protein
MTKGVLSNCEVKMCIQLFWGNFDVNVPFNINNPEGSVLMILYQEHPVETMQIGKLKILKK